MIAHLKLFPAIVETDQLFVAMRSSLTDAPAFPSIGSYQPTHADLMAKLNRKMSAMALKEDVQEAQMEVIKQMRSELTAQIEPTRSRVESAAANVIQA